MSDPGRDLSPSDGGVEQESQFPMMADVAGENGRVASRKRSSVDLGDDESVDLLGNSAPKRRNSQDNEDLLLADAEIAECKKKNAFSGVALTKGGKKKNAKKSTELVDEAELLREAKAKLKNRFRDVNDSLVDLMAERMVAENKSGKAPATYSYYAKLLSDTILASFVLTEAELKLPVNDLLLDAIMTGTFVAVQNYMLSSPHSSINIKEVLLILRSLEKLRGQIGGSRCVFILRIAQRSAPDGGSPWFDERAVHCLKQFLEIDVAADLRTNKPEVCEFLQSQEEVLNFLYPGCYHSACAVLASKDVRDEHHHMSVIRSAPALAQAFKSHLTIYDAAQAVYRVAECLDRHWPTARPPSPQQIDNALDLVRKECFGSQGEQLHRVETSINYRGFTLPLSTRSCDAQGIILDHLLKQKCEEYLPVEPVRINKAWDGHLSIDTVFVDLKKDPAIPDLARSIHLSAAWHGRRRLGQVSFATVSGLAAAVEKSCGDMEPEKMYLCYLRDNKEDIIMGHVLACVNGADCAKELLKQLEATYRIAAILECPEYISHWSRLINQCLQPSESVFRSAVTLPKLPEGTETEVCDKLLKLFEVDKESVMEKFHQIGKGISDKGLSYLCTFGFCLTAHQQAKVTAVLTSRSKDLLVGGSMTRSALSQNKIDISDLMKDLCITR